MTDRRNGPPVTIALRPIGSPLPLGFFAFAIGSFCFTTLEVGWVAPTQIRPLAFMMLAFVVPLQLISAVLSFFARDAGGATALGLIGTSWAAIGLVSLTDGAPNVPVLGVMLVSLAVVMLALAIAAIAGKPVFTAVMTLAASRFALTGIFEMTGQTGWEKVAGWIGLPLVAAAVYLGLALLLEDLQHRTVLPLFRRGAARMSVESHLGDQVREIAHEAGVREQL